MNNRALRRQYCDECGTELMYLDEMYTWTDGRRTSLICGDCFDRMFDELSRYEKAALIGSAVIENDMCFYPS